MLRAGPVLVVASLLVAPASARGDAPPRHIQDLRARIARVLREQKVPGVGLALVSGGRVVWSGGVGLADRATGRPVDADTLFRVGSITKTFIALAVVKLHEEGRLDLRARVSDIAPEIEMDNPWAREAPVTVAHLLEHTAGFDDMRPNEMVSSIADEAMPLGKVLALNPRSRRARWPPGTHMSYANPGYTVAAYLVEKVTGEPYEDYVEREILRPLGMPGARLRWSPEVDARLSRGHDDDGAIPYVPIYHRPAGNLMASPRELAALVQLWLARGRPLISPASAARMERSETADLRGTDVEYGLGVYGDVFGAVPTRGHDGGIDGFVSSYRYVPSRGVGYVVLLNSTGRGTAGAYHRIRALMLSYLLGGRPADPPRRVPVPDRRLASWAGTYQVDNPRMELFSFLHAIGPRLVVRHEPGRLFVRWQGRSSEFELIPLGGDCFALDGASGCALAFARDREGRRAVHGVVGEQIEQLPALAAIAYHGSRAVLWLLASALLVPFMRSARRHHLVPFAATAALFSIPELFEAGARAHALGGANLYTVGICALTVAFAVLSALSVRSAVTLLYRPCGWFHRAYAIAFAAAASAAALFLAHFHLIGLCLWRW